MREGAVRNCFLAFLLSATVGAIDPFTLSDLKHNGINTSGETYLSSDADTLSYSQTAAPDSNSNKISDTGANQYGKSQSSGANQYGQSLLSGANKYDQIQLSGAGANQYDQSQLLGASQYGQNQLSGANQNSQSHLTGANPYDQSQLSGASQYDQSQLSVANQNSQSHLSGANQYDQSRLAGANQYGQSQSSGTKQYGQSLLSGANQNSHLSGGNQYDQSQLLGASQYDQKQLSEANQNSQSHLIGGTNNRRSGGSQYDQSHLSADNQNSHSSGANQYGQSQSLGVNQYENSQLSSNQAYNTKDIQGHSLGLNLNDPSEKNKLESEDDDTLRSAKAFASANGNTGGASSSAISTVQGQGDAAARANIGGFGPYGSGYPGVGYSDGGYASAQAQADASAQAFGGESSPYGSGYPGSGYPGPGYPGSVYGSAQALTQAFGGSGSAQADASAQALSGGSSPYGSGYQMPNYPGAGYPSAGYGSAQVQADASAQAIGGGSSPYSSDYPSSLPGGGYSSAQAQADASSGYGQAQADAFAHAISGGSSPFNSGYPNPEYPGTEYPSTGYDSAQAQADASAGYGSGQAQADALALSISGGSILNNPSYPGSGYPSKRYPSAGYSSAQAQADASAGYGSGQAQADTQAISGGSSSYGSGYGSAQAQANAVAQAAGSSNAHASSSASEYTRPQTRVIPTHELVHPDQIPGALNIITCSREGELHNLWSASHECMVCTCIRQYGYLRPMCASCSGCQAFNPIPPPPQPQPQVTCDPLPRDQYFQNPLNPCQICICNPFVVFGVPDVKITCQEKPECIRPPDAPVIPVIPDIPVPLPLCERFPQNVYFPHPSDYCRLCKCIVHSTLFSIPEQHIECMPNPECERGPPPTPLPFLPPNPPPLPPPQPQVSCDPLPTDQFFQNPMNPCQICVCRPVNTFGLPDVKITCQENPQCVLPPDAPIIPPIPDKPVPLPLCERFPQNVIFPHPSDVCRLCKCVTRITLIGIPEQHIECMPNPDCEHGPPTPPPLPPPYPPPMPPPPPQPQPQVRCDPLPMNQNFQNPLNPCQICICTPVLVFGVPEIKITCQENPQCVLPPDAPVIPHIPDVPVPLPLCERFPKDVLFPHPSDYCRLCKCLVRVSLFGIPEQQIECSPNPECDRPPFPPTPPPFPPYTPIPPPSPEPHPFPPEINPLPPSPYLPPYPPGPNIRPDPVPWPPKPRPGPLPGPTPHESCLPYPPNVPFQHPWDDCQICMCSESHAIGLISIEVNCYTKPSCCVEPPVSPLPLPAPVVPSNKPDPLALQILDLICEFKTFAVQFLHPKDPCKICSCEIFGRFVVPVCQRANKKECSVQPAPIPNNQVIYIEPRCRNRAPYQPFVTNCNMCVCRTVFNYVVAKCEPQPNCYPNDLKPTPYPMYSPEGSQGHASAEANAVVQNYQPGSQYVIPGKPGSQNVIPGRPGSQYIVPGQLQLGGGYSSASAEAQAQANSGYYPSGPGLPGNQYFVPGQPGNQYLIPGQFQQGGGYSSALAEAQAQANSGNYPSRPGLPDNQYLIPGQPGNQYLIPGHLQPGGGYSSALAEAQAQANSGYYPSGPGLPGNQYIIPGQPDNQYLIPGQYQPGGGYSSASAEAQAKANFGNYPSVPNYPYQWPNYQPGYAGTYGGSSAEAQASANAVAEYNPGVNYHEPSSAFANAEALATMNQKQPYYIPGLYIKPNSVVQPNNLSPQYYPGGPSGVLASADASAYAEIDPSPTYNPYAPNRNSYPYMGSNQEGYSSAQAKATARSLDSGLLTDSYSNDIYSQNDYLNNNSPAISRGQGDSLTAGKSPNPTYYDPNDSQNSNEYPTFNDANAEAEAVAASDMYSTLYPRPSPQRTPLYTPGQNGWDNGAAAQSRPLLQGDSNAQGQALPQDQTAGSAA